MWSAVDGVCGLRKASPLLGLRTNVSAYRVCVGCVVPAFLLCCHNDSLLLKFEAQLWQRKTKFKATERPMTRRKDLPQGWTRNWPKCDPKVAKAINDFYENMSDSHSWNSQTYSFSSLSKKFLDASITEYFKVHKVFAGKLPFSEQLRQGADNAICWLDRIASNHFQDQELSCFDSLTDTLESLRDAVIVCSNFKSKDGKIRVLDDEDVGEGTVRKRASRAEGKSKFDKMPQYLKNFLGLVPGVYCEVCDQLTEHYLEKSDHTLNKTVLIDGLMLDVAEMEIQIKEFSKKYCSEHNRKMNPDAYKKANRARTAFYSLMCIKRDGEKLLFGRSKTKHADLRRAAYQVIQTTSLRNLKLATSVVENYYATIPESIADEEARNFEMLKAYHHYFGSKQ